MARSKRVCMPLLTYHAYSRCIEWKDLMREDHVKNVFMDTMKKAQDKYSFELTAYVIMENHFHIVIRTVKGGETISRIMQYIKARFAERFNRINCRTGPFWNERFKDVIVEHQASPLTYLLWLLWYIAWNPVRKGIARDPREYEFSSINNYLNKSLNGPLRITLHEYFLLIGDSFRDRLKNFVQYEEIFITHTMRQSF